MLARLRLAARVTQPGDHIVDGQPGGVGVREHPGNERAETAGVLPRRLRLRDKHVKTQNELEVSCELSPTGPEPSGRTARRVASQLTIHNS